MITLLSSRFHADSRNIEWYSSHVTSSTEKSQQQQSQQQLPPATPLTQAVSIASGAVVSAEAAAVVTSAALITGELIDQRDRWPAWLRDHSIARLYAQLIRDAFTEAISVIQRFLRQLFTGEVRVTPTQAAQHVRGEITSSLRPVLGNLWAESYALGYQSAGALLTKPLDETSQIPRVPDWGWEPGGGRDAVRVALADDISGNIANLIEQHGKNILERISETKLDDLPDIIVNALDTAQPASEVANLIQDALKVHTRADVIAQTEVARAVNRGSMDRYVATGVDLKDWLVAPDEKVCKTCRGNEQDGAIPLTKPFRSGHMIGPAHPRCRCAVAPASTHGVDLTDMIVAPLPGFNFVPLQRRSAEKSHSGESFATCSQGHKHWGAHGAAGIVIRSQRPDGKTAYLIQQRRLTTVDHPGEWATFGGALLPGETAEQGARREVQEELGNVSYQLGSHVVDDHGGWRYTTFLATAPEPFWPPFDGETPEESASWGWYSAAEMQKLKLHPAFRQQLPSLLRAERTEKSMLPDLIKVGPEGYIHGYICVRPPCSKVGDVVTHPVHGDGKIISVRGDGPDMQRWASFDDGTTGVLDHAVGEAPPLNAFAPAAEVPKLLAEAPDWVHVDQYVRARGWGWMGTDDANRAMRATAAALTQQARYIPNLIARSRVTIATGLPQPSWDAAYSGGLIHVDPKVFKYDAQKTLANNIASGWWVPARPGTVLAEHTVAHEVGHGVAALLENRGGLQISYSEGKITSRELWDPLAKALGTNPPEYSYESGEASKIKRAYRFDVESWARINRDVIASHVSRYASKNVDELLAELWCEYTQNDNPRAAAQAYGDFVMTNLPNRLKSTSYQPPKRTWSQYETSTGEVLADSSWDFSNQPAEKMFNPAELRDHHGKWVVVGVTGRQAHAAAISFEDLPGHEYGVDTERGALIEYNGSGYIAMNRALRSKTASNERAASAINFMDRAMTRGVLSTPITVHRGIRERTPGEFTASLGKDWENRDLTGVKWVDHGFVSTSAHADADGGIYSGNRGISHVILHVPAGIPAISISPDEPGEEPGEDEIVLNRGLQYEVTRDLGTIGGQRTVEVAVSPAVITKHFNITEPRGMHGEWVHIGSVLPSDLLWDKSTGNVTHMPSDTVIAHVAEGKNAKGTISTRYSVTLPGNNSSVYSGPEWNVIGAAALAHNTAVIRSHNNDATVAESMHSVSAAPEKLSDHAISGNSHNVTPLYHGSPYQMQPGDLIRQGVKPSRFGMTREGYNYATYSPREVLDYAMRGPHRTHVSTPHVYEVEPTGEYGDDPGTPKSLRSKSPFRVLREISLHDTSKLPEPNDDSSVYGAELNLVHSSLYIGHDDEYEADAEHFDRLWSGRDDDDDDDELSKFFTPDVIKVGPDGYIHGWVCVRPPCDKAGDEVKHALHGNGVITGTSRRGNLTAKFADGYEDTLGVEAPYDSTKGDPAPLTDTMRRLASDLTHEQDAMIEDPDLDKVARKYTFTHSFTDSDGNHSTLTARPLSAYYMKPQGGGTGPSDRGDVHISGDILDEHGDMAGEFVRRFHLDSNGLVVRHDQMTLDLRKQGYGFAREFNQHAEDHVYQPNGIHDILVHADIDVGGYAWARHGYDWASKAQAEHVMKHVQSRLSDESDPLNGGTAEDRADWAKLYRQMKSHNFSDAEYPTPYDVSNIGYRPGKDTWAGKESLMASGYGKWNGWHGVKHLQ